MNAKMQWFKARRIMGSLGSDWPDQLNIEQIAKLHFHPDLDLERDLLSLLREAISNEDITKDGTNSLRVEMVRDINTNFSTLLLTIRYRNHA